MSQWKRFTISMSTTKANKTLLAVGALGVIACAIVWYAVSFFAANGGTRSVKRTGYMITARYCKPGRLVSERSKVIRQMNMGEEREKVLIAEYRETVSTNLVFAIEARLTDPSPDAVRADMEYSAGEGKYSKNLQNMFFGGEQNIFLETTDGKTIRPILCNFERNFGLSPVKSLLVAFDKRQINTNEVTLVVDRFGPIQQREKFNFKIKV